MPRSVSLNRTALAGYRAGALPLAHGLGAWEGTCAVQQVTAEETVSRGSSAGHAAASDPPAAAAEASALVKPAPARPGERLRAQKRRCVLMSKGFTYKPGDLRAVTWCPGGHTLSAGGPQTGPRGCGLSTGSAERGGGRAQPCTATGEGPRRARARPQERGGEERGGDRFPAETVGPGGGAGAMTALAAGELASWSGVRGFTVLVVTGFPVDTIKAQTLSSAGAASTAFL